MTAGLAALWIAAALAGLQLLARWYSHEAQPSRRVGEARRALRFWAAATLAPLAAAAALQLDSPGPGLLVNAIAALVPLSAVLRDPVPPGGWSGPAPGPDHAARLLVLAGLAVALGAFAWSQLGAQQARIARLCEGQSAQMGRWNFALGEISPVAGSGFTALQASLAARRGEHEPVALAPQRRDYFLPASAADATIRTRLWDGDLDVRFTGFDATGGCAALDAAWSPFRGLARLGSWLAALGAALLAVLALVSMRWRTRARARIAMRREENPLPGASAAPAAAPRLPPRWQLIAASLVLGSSAYIAASRLDWLSPSSDAVVASFDRGPALVAARQSLSDGPANLNQWIVIGDAMARRGRFGDAAEVLLGAVESRPHDPQGWLALGDALYGHAGGQLSPAAELAYERADRAAARGGAPPLLVGSAMERSGRAELAARWWRRRLSQAPADAPWRAALEARRDALQRAGGGTEP